MFSRGCTFGILLSLSACVTVPVDDHSNMPQENRGSLRGCLYSLVDYPRTYYPPHVGTRPMDWLVYGLRTSLACGLIR